jgi:hypothetical protein
MRYFLDLSGVLAFAPRHVPLAIRHIADDAVRSYCAKRGVYEGDTVAHVGAMPRPLVLSKDGGRYVLLDLEQALAIEVEPALPS